MDTGNGSGLTWRRLLAVGAFAVLGGGLFWNRLVASQRSVNSEALQPILRELAEQRTLIEKLSRQIAAKNSASAVGIASSKPDPEGMKVAVRAALDERDRDNLAEKQEAEETPSAESMAAYSHGEDIIKAAIGVGRWTRDDRAALMATAAHLTREQYKALHHEVIRAINEDKLELVR